MVPSREALRDVLHSGLGQKLFPPVYLAHGCAVLDLLSRDSFLMIETGIYSLIQTQLEEEDL